MVYIPAYIWLIYMVNVAKYTIHGYYGLYFWAHLGPNKRILVNSLTFPPNKMVPPRGFGDLLTSMHTCSWNITIFFHRRYRVFIHCHVGFAGCTCKKNP